MSRVVYLYGFVAPDSATPPEAVRGLDGSEVELVELGAFQAAVSRLPAAGFDEASLERSLKDLTWVGRHGASHELVVTWFSDHSTIVPARLFTVFSSEEALRTEARERSEVIIDRLRRFRDVREWDLKVSVDHELLAEHLGDFSTATAALDREIADSSPGRRYLLERKRAESVKEEASDVARRLALDLLERLGSASDEVRELAIPAAREGLPVVLNAALLVRSDRAEQIRDSLEERARHLEPKGLHARLSGPWAPYRFLSDASDA